MEWVDGCSLEELIRDGAVDRRLAKKIICELCDSLEYIHRKQVIHRDLKPENILITYNGQNVKLIDFGLSDADSYNVFKAPAGTKVYASPELLAGEQIDSRSDIWSLGTIISEMTGYYAHVAARCLKRNRERRYKTVSDVRKAVVATGRRKAALALLYALIAALITLSLWLVYERLPEPDLTPSEVMMPYEIEDTSSDEIMSVEPKAEPTLQTVESEMPAQDTLELMDEGSLDDLFKEVSGKL
jgi:serine/threonine protein kinase